MDPIDSELDQRLRAVSAPPANIVQRVIAHAMASSERASRSRRRVLVAAATVSIFIAALGLRYWPRRPVEPVRLTRPNVGVVLVRAPDGSSAIYSTAADTDSMPPGSGFVISEGGER